MTAASVRQRRRGVGGFLIFFVAGCTAVLGWAAAQAGLKGVIALGGAVSFAVAMIATRRRADLLLIAGVGSCAALMHKSFGELAEIASGPPSIYVHSFDIMVFVLWMAWFVSGPEDMLEDIRRAFSRPVMWLPVVAYTLMLPSVAVAPNTTLAIAEVVRMSSMFMVFVFFAASITTKRQVIIVVGSLLFIAVVEAVIVAGQYVTTSALGLSVFGTPTILHNRFDGVTFARPFGTMAHPVFMGAFLGPLALLAFSLAVNLRSVKLKWGALIVSVIAVSPLILASARSASFALVLAFFPLALALLTTGRLRGVTAGWWMLTAATGAVLASPYLINLWNKSFRTEHFGVEWESRTQLNDMAVQMFEDRPFFGHGLNNFEEVLPGYDRYGLIFADNPVHNLYLLQLAESGLVGFIGLLVLGVGVFRVSFRLAKSTDRLLSAVGFAMASIYLFWFIEEMLVFSLRQDHPRSLFFILTGLLIACDRMAGTDRVGKRRGPGPKAKPPAAKPARPKRELVSAGRPAMRAGATAIATVLLASVVTFSPLTAGTALAQDELPDQTPPEDLQIDAVLSSIADVLEPTGDDVPSSPDDGETDEAGSEPSEEDAESGAAAAAADPGEEEPLVLEFEVAPVEELPRGVTGSEVDLDIVYTAQSRLDGLRRIFVLKAGSDVPTQVSPEDGQQYSWASWALNGNKIVFTARDGEAGMPESVYWMNADGSELELLLEVPFQSAQPKISNDGTTLLFSGRLPGTTFTRLYGWDMTSGLAWNMSQVGNAGFLDSDPSFSPDSRSVVFIDSQRDGQAVPGEVALMRASGQGHEQLTNNGLFDTDPQITTDLDAMVSARYTGEGAPRDPNSPNPFQVVLFDFKIIERDLTTNTEVELTEGLSCFLVPSDFSCSPTQGSSYLPKYTPDDTRVGYITILSSNTTCICVVGRDGSEPLARYTDTFHVVDWFDWVVPGDIPAGAPEVPVRPDRLPDAIERLFDFDVEEIEDIPVESTASDAALDVVFAAESRVDGSTRLYLLESGSSIPVAISPNDGRIYGSPSFAFGGTKIVFAVQETSGLSELWWMNRDGTQVEPLLVLEDASLQSPTVSPDGTTLVFASSGLMFSWDLATGFVVNITAASTTTTSDFDPQFGLDNEELVFTNGGEIGLIDPSGQDRRVVTENGLSETSPTLSGDATTIATARFLTGELPPVGSVGGFGIVTIDRTTLNETQLTQGLSCHRVPARYACTPEQSSGFFPRFTPDNERLGFVAVLSSRAVCVCTIGVDGANPVARWITTDLAVSSFDWGVRNGLPPTAISSPLRPGDIVDLVDFAVVRPEDLPRTALDLDVVFTATSRSDSQTRVYVLPAGAAFPEAVSPNDRRTYRWAAWALGTTKIVYSVQDGDGPEEIWWMNRNGTDPKPLIALNSSVTEPRVSPDGKTLVFTFPVPGTGFTEVFALDLASGWVDNLSTVSGAESVFDSGAGFSLDGSRITLMDRGAIATIAPDGTGRQTVLADGDAVYANPALNADGSRLVASSRPASEPAGVFTALVASPLSPGQTQLTSGNECDAVPDAFNCLPDGGMGLYPIFTPDNDQVGYVSVLSATTMCICIAPVEAGDVARAGFISDELIVHRFDWHSTSAVAPDDAIEDPTRPEDLLKDLLVTVSDADGVGIERTRADRFLKEIVDISGSVEPRDASASADGNVIVFTAEVDPDSPIPLLEQVEDAPAAADTSREVHYTINLRDEAVRDLPLTREAIVSSQLFMVYGDGTGLRQLTTVGTEDPRDAIRDGDRRGNLLADVSPDGRYVVFTNISTSTEESFILRLDLETGDVLSLTNATAGALPTHDTDPKWSPDGTQVAFVSDSWGVPEVWVMDADGGNARPVSDGVEGRFPAWSADGGSISFAADNTLMLLDLESGEMVEFASHDDASVSRSAWSADGQFVAWVAFDERGVADLYLRTADGSRDLTKLTAGSAELGVDW